MNNEEQEIFNTNQLIEQEFIKEYEEKNNNFEINLITFVYCLFKEPNKIINGKYLNDEKLKDIAIKYYQNNVIFHAIFTQLEQGFNKLYKIKKIVK